MLAAAAILLVIWPGHDIPPMSMTADACRQAAMEIAAAAQYYRRENPAAVPGFKVWCEPDNAPPRLVS
jgi:hypothetical protein